MPASVSARLVNPFPDAKWAGHQGDYPLLPPSCIAVDDCIDFLLPTGGIDDLYEDTQHPPQPAANIRHTATFLHMCRLLRFLPKIVLSRCIFPWAVVVIVAVVVVLGAVGVEEVVEVVVGSFEYD